MRLIDADVLREEVYSWGMNDYEPLDFIDAIDDAPTVEAIPKAEYEVKLKADLVDILTELKNKIIDKSWNIDMYDDDLDFECCYLNDIDKVIQQKINSLKEERNERNEVC
jgi:hypothetical protein